MKQRVNVSGLKQRSQGSHFTESTELNNDTHSFTRPPAHRNGMSSVAPSDISGVRSSTFRKARRKYESDSTSEFPRVPPRPPYRDNLSNLDHQDRLGEILFKADGYHTEGTHNVICAAKGDENESHRNDIVKSSRVAILPHNCLRRWLFAVCFLFFGTTVPITIVKLFGVNEPLQYDAAAHVSRILETLGAASRYAKGRDFWRNHVVVGDGNRLLIPETFESRLNAEVAPVLQEHISQVWDIRRYPELVCQRGEHLIVAFSLVKSASLPASVSYERPCPSAQRLKNCMLLKRLSDVRDLSITLPSKSSRYMFSVKMAVDRVKPRHRSQIPSLRRFEPFGTVSGPFQVELSDGSLLALQRYCGGNKKNFADDLDVEQVRTDNTRLLTIYELKRMYALWARPQKGTFDKTRNLWDALHMSKAVIYPIEHSRHSFSALDLTSLLSSSPYLKTTGTEVKPGSPKPENSGVFHRGIEKDIDKRNENPIEAHIEGSSENNSTEAGRSDLRGPGQQPLPSPFDTLVETDTFTASKGAERAPALDPEHIRRRNFIENPSYSRKSAAGDNGQPANEDLSTQKMPGSHVHGRGVIANLYSTDATTAVSEVTETKSPKYRDTVQQQNIVDAGANGAQFIETGRVQSSDHITLTDRTVPAFAGVHPLKNGLQNAPQAKQPDSVSIQYSRPILMPSSTVEARQKTKLSFAGKPTSSQEGEPTFAQLGHPVDATAPNGQRSLRIWEDKGLMSNNGAPYKSERH